MLLFEWLVSGAGGFVGSGGGGGEAPLSPGEWWALAGICFLLVAFAGLASGLTLGLMSLDAVDVEVLRRSGTPDEKRCADAIAPVIANEHFLLVTLLLCNAAANEALPLFLDRLADPVTAVVLSTTVVLVFGEVVPQALCSRYGLQIGASSAWLVRGLMLVTAPLSWPIGRLLDALLGGEHTALFRRAQLKALVGLHAEGEGLGGTLSADEIAVITGALDLTHKTAHAAMTALGSVFMLPAERAVDEACLQEILSRGHSRVPVFTGGDRGTAGRLLLAKELVLVDPSAGLRVGDLPTRPLPRLSAATPLYDMLRLFESGGSHMALLVRPAAAAAASGGGGGSGSASSAAPQAASSSVAIARDLSFVAGDANNNNDGSGWAPPGGWGDAAPGDPVGIITIEDVVEELLGAEIVDETDVYVDNAQSAHVDAGEMLKALPARLRRVLARGDFTPRIGRLGVAPPPPPAAAHMAPHPEEEEREGGEEEEAGEPAAPPAGGDGGGGATAAEASPTTAPPGGGAGGRAAAPERHEAAGGPSGVASAVAGQSARPRQRPRAPPARRPSFTRGSGGASAAPPPAAPPPTWPPPPPPGGAAVDAAAASPGSVWAAGANTGARRVRFGGDAPHGAVVLKPRLVDPHDQHHQHQHRGGGGDGDGGGGGGGANKR